MRLLKYELKKMMLMQKGAFLLLICFLLKAIFLCVFPEQKDPRIVLSQKQYDKYLLQLAGESTPEKNDWIISEFASFQYIKDIEQDMREAYSNGSLTDDEWHTYYEQLQVAELRMNAAGIFAEKAEQFLNQPESLPKAHYIYEYGWQTIFLLLQFPDVFLLFGLILLTSQCFSAEVTSGMMPVLMASRNGRQKLYDSKLFALLIVVILSCGINCLLETGIFLIRGWGQNGNVPIYSVSVLSEATISLTAWEAYFLCHLVRSVAVVLFSSMLLGLSVWIPSPQKLIFSGLCILGLPILLLGKSPLYLHSGLLSGTQMLLQLDQSLSDLLAPIGAVSAYSFAIALAGRRRNKKGL